MSRSTTTKQTKDLDDYSCSVNGPRWPVPGEESRAQMTVDETSQGKVMADAKATEQLQRILKWQEDLDQLLNDEEGVALFFQFVEQDAGTDSAHYRRLQFYFACNGLKRADGSDEGRLRQLINAIYRGFMSKANDATAPIPANLITEELKNTIKRIKKLELPPDHLIFDGVQKAIFDIIKTTIYPHFKSSTDFIQYVSQIEQSVDTSTIVAAAATASTSAALIPTASQPRTNLLNKISDISTDGNTNPTYLSKNNNNTSSINNNSSGGNVPASIAHNVPILNELPTLAEDSELVITDRTTLIKPSTRPKLTKEMLLATQAGRLEVRPAGAVGYTYNIKYNASYNPVTRADSGRQSCSSASLSDAEVRLKDGKTHGLHRRRNMPEQCINPSIAHQTTVVRPVTQDGRESFGDIPKARLEKASQPLDHELLSEKLKLLQKEQDEREKKQQHEHFSIGMLNDRLTQMDDFDNQAILDQHVSRVFSPIRTPGTVSPGQPHRPTSRYTDMSASLTDFNAQALRHSRSTPDHASVNHITLANRRIPHKWPSTTMDIDSGISMYSTIAPHKAKEYNDDTLRSAKDENRRSRRPLPTPFSSHPSTMSTHHTNSLPRLHETNDDYTFAVCTFSDEKVPYRIRLSGRHITLKQFKEHLPKKGHFRYFFQTTCDDPDNPIIQEEVISDMDEIPLYEGKIMGTMK